VARKSADDESLRRDVDGIQSRQAVNVDHRTRGHQAHVERGDEALASGQNPAVLAVTVQQIEGLREGERTVRLERGRLHRRTDPIKIGRSTFGTLREAVRPARGGASCPTTMTRKIWPVSESSRSWRRRSSRASSNWTPSSDVTTARSRGSIES